MVKNKPKQNLLKRTNPEVKNFELIEREEPNLYREIFPYNKIPIIDFDKNDSEISPAENFLITDTTFRDGQQARPPYTVEQIIDIFKILNKLGGVKGIIRKTEFFLYSAKDKEAVRKCQELDLEFPKITGWIRATTNDLKLVKEMNLSETGILTSLSDYHIYLKLKLNRKQALEKYLSLVKDALNMGIVPRCHLEDITRADIYGFVIPFAQELKKVAQEAGSKIILRLCDTMGMGISYPGAALPRSVPKLVRALIDDAGFDGEDLEWHGHNDFHKGLINATTSWLYGLSSINASLLGFGERTGNTPLEALMIEHAALTGFDSGLNFLAITEMAQYFEKNLNYKIPYNYPLVGRDFNVTSAGIHADGLLKNEEIYNIFNTEEILNRAVSISINDKSGTAGLTHWLNQKLKLINSAQIDKQHPGIVKMNKVIQKQYEEGRVSNMSSVELEKLARHYLPNCFSSTLDNLKFKVKNYLKKLLEDFIKNSELSSMNSAKQEKIMKVFAAENYFIQFIYITDINGIKTTKNITQLNSKAKFSGIQGVGFDLSDRDWFVFPVNDGKIYITDLYTSCITKALCITVSGPIRNEQDEIVGVAGMDIKFEDLAKMEEEFI